MKTTLRSFSPLLATAALVLAMVPGAVLAQAPGVIPPPPPPAGTAVLTPAATLTVPAATATESPAVTGTATTAVTATAPAITGTAPAVTSTAPAATGTAPAVTSTAAVTGTAAVTSTAAEAPLPPPPARKPLEGPIRMNFKDASVHTVLEYLSGAAGLVVVEDTPVEGRVSVMSLQPLTVDEAVALLNTILKDKGYAAVRIGRTLKIVALAEAKKAGIPVRSGADPEKIDASDQVVTQIIPVQFADANALKANLTTLLPTYADLQANVSTNSLILTATTTDIKRIVEIVHSLDSQVAATNEVKVFQLQYANAANTARLITDLFRSDSSTTGGTRFGGNTGGGGRGGPGGGGPGGGGPGGIAAFLFGGGGDAASSAGARQQKVTASSDDRTNTLVVSAPSDLLTVIEGVVKKIDSNPAADQAVFTYRLKNADAANLESVINNLFGTSSGSSASRTNTTNNNTNRTSLLGSTGSSTGGRGGSSGSSSSTMRGLSTTGTTSNRGTTSTANRGTTTSGRGTTGVGRLSTGSQAAASDLSGQVFVVADTDTNSLLVTTGSKNFPRVKTILDELDRPVPQVLIKVLIAEVSHNNTLDLGIEASAINLSTSAGPGFKVGTNYNVAAQTQGLVFKLVEDHVTAALHALEGVGKVDILSRPYVLTSDNQQASIMVGQSVPIPNASQITEAGQTNTSFYYQDIGIMLTVTPHINPDGLVIMDVYPEISSTADSTIQLSPNVFAPVFNKRSAGSRVAIRDGQTIVIGGLMEDRIEDHVDKVPFLGDLPGIGPLFQHITKDKTKTELLIFLTPHVAQVPEALNDMSAGEMAGTKVIRGAVEEGAFDDQMKGMRQGGAPAGAVKPVPPVVEPMTDDNDADK
jgi:general secretion pathway protein D